MNSATDPQEHARLKAEHTPGAVADRLSAAPRQNYLRDFTYGAIDGSVTTFAIVSGVVGADLSYAVVIILGISNVLADGFSMAVSGYLATKSEKQLLDRARVIEETHVDAVPDGEAEEIRQIFAQKGFEGELLDRVVNVITANRKLWVETMLTEEWGLSLSPPSASKAAIVTFVAFVCVGLVPLLPFVVFYWMGAANHAAFVMSALFTAVVFFTIGALKSFVIATHWFRSGLETLLMGGAAAGVAYFVGAMLKDLA